MIRALSLALFVCTILVAEAAVAKKRPLSAIVLASEQDAALDSNLMTGGGTDDTAVLQRILNKAEKGHPVHLIVDGPALVSGLDVYGNTTLECIGGGGLYLKAGSNRAIVRNVHRSRDAIIDERITIRGCFLHGNKNGQNGTQTHTTLDGVTHVSLGNQETDGTHFSGLQFFGVNYLTIENVTLWNVRAFAAYIGNANRIDVHNVIVDTGIPSNEAGLSMDGFHFNGPIRYLTIDGMKLRTFDDGLALNANDGGVDDLRIKNEMGPYVGQGPITDVTVNNIQFMESFFGIRLLSSTERIDRVVINNVTGTVQAKLAIISHYSSPGLGNFGSIAFSNVAVDAIKPYYKIRKELHESPIWSLEVGGREGSLFVLNGHVESLNLRNIMTTAIDSRPVIWSGPDSLIRMLSGDLSIYDPARQSTPIKQEKGSRIERLDLKLNWQGDSSRLDIEKHLPSES